jgi:4-alpha-glucanotransferase
MVQVKTIGEDLGKDETTAEDILDESGFERRSICTYEH